MNDKLASADLACWVPAAGPHADHRLKCRLVEGLDGIPTLEGGFTLRDPRVAPKRFARAAKASPPVIADRIAITNSRSYPRPIRCSPCPHWLPEPAWVSPTAPGCVTHASSRRADEVKRVCPSGSDPPPALLALGPVGFRLPYNPGGVPKGAPTMPVPELPPPPFWFRLRG